ncbi:MAG: trigger factor [Gammaproteobacteria bacterium]|nr:trigger factor [Gammaproteobacteria bacterium]
MQVSVENGEGLERKMTIAVPGERVDSAVDSRLRDAAKSAHLKGFRRGKVPFKVIKNKLGKGVRGEVINELINQSVYEAITQESLQPAGQPKIEATNTSEGENLEFVAIFEVYPEVILPDFTKIKVEKLTAEVKKDDLKTMIETLREQRKTWEDVDRNVADKDLVNIDYVGKKGGEEFEGGAAKAANLVIGSDQMVPGFESGIVGRSKGEEFVIDLKFPEEYQSPELAGQSVEFDITINSVKQSQLPEVNEEFFKSFGVEDGGEEAFHAEIMTNMERELKAASRAKIKNKITDALIEVINFEIPGALVSNEVQGMKAQAMQRMGSKQELDPSLLPDDLFLDQAERRVTLGLVLGEVVKEKNLQADSAKVRETVEELASTYESPDEVIDWYYGNKEQLATIESSVIEDQVFDLIIDEAIIIEKNVSYQEAIEPEKKDSED